MPEKKHVDDATIPSESKLWRRIPKWQWTKDENLGRVRPSSAAFEDEELSVFLKIVLDEKGLGVDHVLEGHQGFAVASIAAGIARECKQAVVRDPMEGSPAHGLVVGKKTDGTRKKFYKNSEWVVSPDRASGSVAS